MVIAWKKLLVCSIYGDLGHISEKAMAPHSSTLAWKIPWAEEPGRLQSMGSRRVGHDWATWLSLFTFMHWRRQWQASPVLLPGKSHGQRSLAGYSPWGCKESDMTEQLNNNMTHTVQILILGQIKLILGSQHNQTKFFVTVVIKETFNKNLIQGFPWWSGG